MGFAVNVVAPNVMTTGLSVWVLSPMFCFAAAEPVLDIPVALRTVNPPPVSPVLVAVKVVEVADPIKEFLMEIAKYPVVPPPVDETIFVYAPLPSELLSVIRLSSAPANPDPP